MNRIRRYDHFDRADLEQLAARLNYTLPELGPELGGIQFVLEDGRGRVKVALVGESCFSLIPLLDPAQARSKEGQEQVKAVLELAESKLIRAGRLGFTAMLLLAPKLKEVGHDLSDAGVFPLPAGWSTWSKIIGFPERTGRAS